MSHSACLDLSTGVFRASSPVFRASSSDASGPAPGVAHGPTRRPGRLDSFHGSTCRRCRGARGEIAWEQPRNPEGRRSSAPFRITLNAMRHSDQVLAGGGAMGSLMRSIDWAATPLGAVETWPQSLRMMVRFLLANRFPLLLWWGPEYIQLYNDAYRPVLGNQAPPIDGPARQRVLPRDLGHHWSTD